MILKELVDSIAKKHMATGINIMSPATTSDIANFEEKIGFDLPEDFKEFYLTCNGFWCNEDI
ncbi:MAG: SMI1/KNR4 family protein, partial [Flavobacterium sp.]